MNPTQFSGNYGILDSIQNWFEEEVNWIYGSKYYVNDRCNYTQGQCGHFTQVLYIKMK